jgi:hypothetical protein
MGHVPLLYALRLLHVAPMDVDVSGTKLFLLFILYTELN